MSLLACIRKVNSLSRFKTQDEDSKHLAYYGILHSILEEISQQLFALN